TEPSLVSFGRNAAITRHIHSGYSFSGTPPYCRLLCIAYGGLNSASATLRSGSGGISNKASPQTILFTWSVLAYRGIGKHIVPVLSSRIPCRYKQMRRVLGW